MKKIVELNEEDLRILDSIKEELYRFLEEESVDKYYRPTLTKLIGEYTVDGDLYKGAGI